MKSVSYTHLDVYKRQVQNRSSAVNLCKFLRVQRAGAQSLGLWDPYILPFPKSQSITVEAAIFLPRRVSFHRLQQQPTGLETAATVDQTWNIAASGKFEHRDDSARMRDYSIQG